MGSGVNERQTSGGKRTNGNDKSVFNFLGAFLVAPARSTLPPSPPKIKPFYWAG